jgi:hypothetical protein
MDTDCDSIFLVVLAGISGMILAIDFKVLEKMFQEYFKLKYYLPRETYEECYRPQAELRMAFECYAIYSAVICTALTFALAFNLSDEKLEWLARKTINVSFLIYGPVLTAISMFGTKDLKALSHMCTINGI